MQPPGPPSTQYFLLKGFLIWVAMLMAICLDPQREPVSMENLLETQISVMD
jgi:hypothetical protein